jgi:hypothetical protein
MRRNRLERGSMDELARRIDQDFAERLAAQPGFVSYEFIDCGLGEFMTLSIFLTLDQAEASRALARTWAEENRDALEFSRVHSVHGEIHVGRADEHMLEETHVGDPRRSVAIRRYGVQAGTVGELMRRIDAVFADRFRAMEGFEAWHVFDCGDGEVLWISFVRDHTVAEESDDRTFRFITEELRDFRLERRMALRGELVVSRARTELLEPARA